MRKTQTTSAKKMWVITMRKTPAVTKLNSQIPIISNLNRELRSVWPHVWECSLVSRDLYLNTGQMPVCSGTDTFSVNFINPISVCWSKLEVVQQCPRASVPGAHSCWLKSRGEKVALLASKLLLLVLMGQHSISLFHFLNKTNSYHEPTQNEGGWMPPAHCCKIY